MWLVVLGVCLGTFWALLGPLGGLLGASWGFLGASWGTPGGLWAASWRRDRFLIDFHAHFGLPKSLNLGLKFLQKWSIDSESLFWPSGRLWGSFGARFWAHFHIIFGLLRPEAGFLKIVLPLQREHDFRGSGGLKKSPKWLRKQLPAATWLQERLGGLWGSILSNLEAQFGA